MFSKAYNLAKSFTHPLVVAMRYHDKTVESGLGAFVVLNEDGWLMTAAHNFGAAFAFGQHQQELAQFNEKAEKINANTQIKEHQRKVLAQALKPNPKWITDFAVMLAGQRIEVLEHFFYQENDIAFMRVDKNFIKGQLVFPKIIDPSKINPGTSLCKFGYPFVEVKANFNIASNQFDLPANLLPVPFFPIEGIYTRNMLMGKTQDQQREILFLETSSPGLKGQSGGPICDTEGNIYAVQSQNLTIPLGFLGTVEINKKKVEENQFFNVGIGVHPKIIVDLLVKHNIKFALAS
ncbi:MAG TPA: trypsin-like peptidase domain-containing protein [Ferruginibacter sp.]|nr:trypsin-like peptidase domain-containing protein [Ferruginibacter sp.]HPH92202.1 trypsin-like peptidase domain-containing protein [Ferruginibacter sp.]